MVEKEPGKVRLVSRGLPDSEDEDQQQVIINHPHTVAPARDTHSLNLSGLSRKRKTVEPITGEQTVIVLPSPTTQIAHQINSIRLAGTPVYGYTSRLPMLGMEAAKDTSIQNNPHQGLSLGGAIVNSLPATELLMSGSKRPTILDKGTVEQRRASPGGNSAASIEPCMLNNDSIHCMNVRVIITTILSKFVSVFCLQLITVCAA